MQTHRVQIQIGEEGLAWGPELIRSVAKDDLPIHGYMPESLFLGGKLLYVLSI
jgi:hypothetical protein